MNRQIEVPSLQPEMKLQSRKAGWGRWLRRSCWAVAVVPMVVFGASLLGRYFLVCELICNFRAYILGALLISFPALLYLKQKWLMGLGLGAAVWASVGTVSVYLPIGPVPTNVSVEQKITIMSFNVLGTNEQYAGVVAEIKRLSPDVLVVLEYANDWKTVLERIEDDYPYRILRPRWHGFGVAVFSKLKFSDARVIQIAPDRTDNPFPMVTVHAGQQRLRIAGVHLLSPMDSDRLEIRNQQIREIGDVLVKTTVPTVLVGDFNCVPWSAYLSDFLNKTGYRDSRQGFGYGGTWHARKGFMSLPIDHAFVSNRVQVHRRTIGRNAESDHFPILLEVSVVPAVPAVPAGAAVPQGP